MSELSPAAQAVLDAAYRRMDDNPFNEVEATLATALRTAAEQVVPEEPLYGGDQRWMFERDARQACRMKLLAIAAELEAQ
jgi:hypothetical protein